jgi:polyvinyl alcohol dehydrogenase (cytochrome)
MPNMSSNHARERVSLAVREVRRRLARTYEARGLACLVATLAGLQTSCAADGGSSATDIPIAEPTQIEEQSSDLSATLLSDGFESGSFSSRWTASGDATVRNDAARTGSFGARVGRGGALVASFDTLGRTGISVSYELRSAGFELLEYVAVQWALPGGSFSELVRFDQTSWGARTLILPASASNRAGVRLRFIVNASNPLGLDSGFEGGYLDNVVVRGETGQAPACSSASQCSASQACVSNQCLDRCLDGVRDGAELGIDCGGDCEPCGSRRVLFSEPFDSGLTRWSAVGNASVTQDLSSYQGGPSARLTGNASLETSVSTLGYDSLTLRYVRSTNGFDSGELFRAELSADGVSYTQLESFEDSNLNAVSFPLPSGVSNVANLRLRFRSNASWFLLPEYAVLDNVVLEGRVTVGVDVCTSDAACSALETSCARGVCNLATGQCGSTPRASGTACGSATATECDLADSCDGMGQCLSRVLPPGSACGAGRLCDDLARCLSCGVDASSTYALIQHAVFDSTRHGCTASTCHGSSPGQAQLNLTPALSYEQLLAAPSTESSKARVEPGQPDQSFLIEKLAAATLGTPLSAGGPMPAGGSPAVPPRKLSATRSWIAAGAPQTGFVPGSVAGLCDAPCAVDADCSNGDVCDGAERCAEGVCVAGSAPDCADTNPCTNDRCDALSGCQNVLTPGLACPGGVCDASGACSACVAPENTYDAIQTLIFDSPTYGCALGTCHSATARGGLDLRADISYGELFEVGDLRVVPGNAAASVLHEKLLAKIENRVPSTGGGAMPPGARPAITNNLMQGVATWINAGAPRFGQVPGTETSLCVPPTTPPSGLLTQVWDLPLTKAVTSSPLVVGSVVYVTSWDGNIYALDRASGAVVWQFATGARAVQAGVAQAPDGSLVVGDGEAVVWHLDTGGNVLWSRDLDITNADHIWQTVTIHNGVVYVPIASHSDVPCTKGRTMALDLATGTTLWTRFNVPEGGVCRGDTGVLCSTSADCPDAGECVSALGGSVTGHITVDPDGQSIYVNTVGCYTFPSVGDTDSMMKLNAQTGATEWIQRVSQPEQFNYCVGSGLDCRTSADCPGGAACNAKLAYHDFGFLNGPHYINALDPQGFFRPIVVSASKNGSVYAFHAETGASVWTQQVLPAPVSPSFAGYGLFNAAMAYADHKFYAALYEFVPAVNPGPKHLMSISEVDGSIKWSDEIGRSWSSPAVSSGVVYVGTQTSPVLYSYDAKTGVRLGTYPLPQTTASLGAVSDAHLYIGYGVGGTGGVRAYHIE